MVLPAYFLGWITNQTSFITFLLVSGILGRIIQYYVQKRLSDKDEDEKDQDSSEEQKDPLAQLPKDVQELIKEGDSIAEENQVKNNDVNA